MLRFVAAVVLLIFTALAATDAVCCPDGCTNQEQTSQSQRTEHSPDAGTCMQCLGGIAAPAAPILASCGSVSDDIARLTFVGPDNVNPDPPERPPRS